MPPKLNNQQPRHYFHGDIRPEDGLIYNGNTDDFEPVDKFWASERFCEKIPTHRERLKWNKVYGASNGYFRPKNAPNVIEDKQTKKEI